MIVVIEGLMGTTRKIHAILIKHTPNMVRIMGMTTSLTPRKALERISMKLKVT